MFGLLNASLLLIFNYWAVTMFLMYCFFINLFIKIKWFCILNSQKHYLIVCVNRKKNKCYDTISWTIIQERVDKKVWLLSSLPRTGSHIKKHSFTLTGRILHVMDASNSKQYYSWKLNTALHSCEDNTLSLLLTLEEAEVFPSIYHL